MKPNYDAVVIGGGYSGLTAVDRIARQRPATKLLLIDTKREFVERIRLHEVAAGRDRRIFDYEPHLEARGVDFLQGNVCEIRTSPSTVTINLANGGGEEVVDFRYLVLALGSASNRTLVPGIIEHAVCLDSVGEVGTLAAWAQESQGQLVVVGGGLTAFEAAAEFAERYPGLDVTLLAAGTLAASQEPGGYCEAAIEHLRKTFERLKIHFRENSRVEKLEAGKAILKNGDTVVFDRCIWAGGFRVSDLPRRAGIDVAENGRVLCTPTLQSVSHRSIIATGDIANAVADPGGPCRMSCAAGRPMGEAAAATTLALLEGTAPPAFRFAYTFRCVSLGRNDGLIQFVDFQDRPSDDIWTGSRAAKWKEYVCQRTVAGVGLIEEVLPPDNPPVPLTSQNAFPILYGEG
ncbi:MAG: FAD-dependent oxidoreductase [Gemmataceae bacterium]